MKLHGIGVTLKRKLLEALGVFKPQTELERKLEGATDLYDVERRLQEYERDSGCRPMIM